MEPIRLQEYGVGIFETTPTKSSLKKALKNQWVTVNDQLATTATFINGGETIKLKLQTNVKPDKVLELPLEILYEDSYMAAVYKPPGILVSGNKFKTIANALPQVLLKSEISDSCTAQPVHRLDFGTSGVLLVGKTQSSIRELNSMFEQKRINKTYFAVTIGKMPLSGSISSSIEAKESLSEFVIEKTVSSDKYHYVNLVKLIPKTGRRHQLRIHLSRIGYPILGDKTYGDNLLITQAKGLYLHAFSVQMIHPFTKEKLHIKAPLPKKFKSIFGEITY